jgi:preprotein translocase subunit SecF
MDTVQIIDNAITSTISRTIITHGSTQIMVLSMLLFGGPTLFYFALALTIGICFSIYSSVFVAAAMAMWLGLSREDLIKAETKKGDQDPKDPNAGAGVRAFKPPRRSVREPALAVVAQLVEHQRIGLLA